MLTRYVECLGCGFVLEAHGPSEPEPKRWAKCPDCGHTDFGFADD